MFCGFILTMIAMMMLSTNDSVKKFFDL
jgi:hypothetical protein